MKKIVLNISDSTYERFKFEAILERKSITQVIEDRIYHKPFHPDVEEAYLNFIDEEVNRILKE